MSSDALASLLATAQGPPTIKTTIETWYSVVKLLDQLPDAQLSAAVQAFEAAAAHWPSQLEDWAYTGCRGRFLADEPCEVRRTPVAWVAEIYKGQASEKHRLARILDSPRRPMRGQKLEHLLSVTQNLSRVVDVQFQQVPITVAFLKLWRGDGPWRQWERVMISSCALSPSHLKQITNADLSCARSLRLNQIPGAEGAKAIKSAPGWTALRELDLVCNSIGDEGAKALASAPWLSKLERLNLSANDLSDEGFARLAGQLPMLTWLELSNNPLGKAAGSWTTNKSLPALSFLSLRATQLTDKSLSDLLATAAPTLSALVLSDTAVSDEGAEAIAASGRALTVLDISESKVGATGTAAILKSPSMQGLKSLHLSAGGVTRSNAKLLIDGALPLLQRLQWTWEDGIGPDASVVTLLEKSRLQKVMNI